MDQGAHVVTAGGLDHQHSRADAKRQLEDQTRCIQSPISVSWHAVLCCAVQSGLSRLAEAAKTIDELSQQAQLQRALLARKQEEADRALADIQVGVAWQ